MLYLSAGRRDDALRPIEGLSQPNKIIGTSNWQAWRRCSMPAASLTPRSGQH